ncbi:RhuM family protein [Selenomonas ruminantium]|uniref:RhuM family protein n=1 Tax=Selenomonas ruminantium TaxID=971 RepID=UPI0015A64C96
MQEQDTNFYNLDAIISVGYRVNSKRDTRFRRHCLRNLTFRRRGINKIRGTIIFRGKASGLMGRPSTQVGRRAPLRLCGEVTIWGWHSVR